MREPGIVFRSYPVTKEFNDGNIAFKAQYEGDVAKFRELFLKYGYYDGKEVVLRIVLKNGKVVLPSYLWIYPAIRRERWINKIFNLHFTGNPFHWVARFFICLDLDFRGIFV